MNEGLEEIRRHFGVYGSDKKFDDTVNALLGVGLPVAAVREMVGNIWDSALLWGTEE